MDHRALSYLIFAAVFLAFGAIYACRQRGKVPAWSYWLTIGGVLALAVSAAMRAWSYCVWAGPYGASVRPSREAGTILLVVGISGMVAGILGGGYVTPSSARYDRSDLLPHKRLAVIYLAIPLAGVFPFLYGSQHIVGLSYPSLARALGPSYSMLMLRGAYLLLGVMLVALMVLWASRRAEAAVRSRWSLWIPPAVAAALGGALFWAVWLRIQNLVAQGMIWPSDVRSSVLVEAFLACISVLLVLFGWHAILGSGSLGNRKSRPGTEPGSASHQTTQN